MRIEPCPVGQDTTVYCIGSSGNNSTQTTEDVLAISKYPKIESLNGTPITTIAAKIDATGPAVPGGGNISARVDKAIGGLCRLEDGHNAES
jgi:hypothetical protein